MIFLSWVRYQRRNETICERFGLDCYYLFYSWQNNSVFHKIIATIAKIFSTIFIVFKNKSGVVAQIPSVFLLYVLGVVKFFCRGHYIVADCHNNIFYDSIWSRFPFLVFFLSKLDVVVVHNECVLKHMNDKFKVLKNIVVVKDLVPSIGSGDLNNKGYIFIPCSLGEDEPVVEMIDAIRMSPDIRFIITKRNEQILSKLPIGQTVPKNLTCTGFLSEADFNKYLLESQAVLVLTKREGTQPSGAVEALGARKIIILSDLRTTRLLFCEVAEFCDNTPSSICLAAKKALKITDIDFNKVIEEYEELSLDRLGAVLKND